MTFRNWNIRSNIDKNPNYVSIAACTDRCPAGVGVEVVDHLGAFTGQDVPLYKVIGHA